MCLTLLADDRLLSFALSSFGLLFIRDLAGHGAGHVQLVDVQRGLIEGGHGGVHACVAVGRAAERGQVQGFPARDDGDVERELAPAVRRGRLGDGEGRRGGELAAGSRRGGRLAVQEFVVLTAGEEKLQGAAGEGRREQKEKSRFKLFNLERGAGVQSGAQGGEHFFFIQATLFKTASSLHWEPPPLKAYK